MCRREGIVDVDIAQFGKSAGKVGRICFLTLVEAEVFEKGDLPRPKRGDHSFGLVANAIRGKGYLPAGDRLLQRRDQGPQRKGWVRPALGAAEMRHDDNFGAFVDQRLYGRREPLDSGRVGHDTVLDRDVQIGAQQHPFAAHIDVVEGIEARHGTGISRFPNTGGRR